MYKLYIDGLMFPITPQKIDIKINNNNKTLNLINDGEINVLKTAGLTDVSFDLELPNTQYPYAIYENGFKNAKYYLEHIERLKVEKKPFQFIVTRTKPNGELLFDTNMKVSIEDYTIKENTSNALDVIVSIKLKQYKSYSTKTMQVTTNEEKTVVTQTQTRETDTTPKTETKTYTVVKGDCLYLIAKRFYEDGNKWRQIYNANKDKIKNPNLIYPKQVLVIP